MAKVAIITRAYNRLEYTMMAIRAVHELANGFDYEHIIIEQNSSDGTKQWLKSIEIEGFYPLKVKYNKVNSGDAGGMKDGFDMISDDTKYVMQLDNDFKITTDDFLNKLVGVMEADSLIGGIGLTRDGVSTHLKLTNNCETINNIKLCEPTRLYSIFYRVDILQKLNHWVTGEKIGWVFSISSAIKILGYKIYKTPDIRLLHIDGHPSVTKYKNNEQIHRYPIYFNDVKNGTNYKNFKYK